MLKWKIQKKPANFHNKNVFSQKVGARAGAASTRANKGLFQLGGLRLRYRNDAFKNDNLYLYTSDKEQDG